MRVNFTVLVKRTGDSLPTKYGCESLIDAINLKEFICEHSAANVFIVNIVDSKGDVVTVV